MEIRKFENTKTTCLVVRTFNDCCTRLLLQWPQDQNSIITTDNQSKKQSFHGMILEPNHLINHHRNNESSLLKTKMPKYPTLL